MRLKWLSLLFIPVVGVLMMSHNTSAASTIVNISNFNGFYGYQVGNNTPGRNVNISGPIPLELLTASATTEKDLYGVAQKYYFNISEAATYKVTTRFVLRQRIDTYNIDTPQANKTSSWTFADNSTVTTNCTVRYDYETSYYLVVFDCSYSGSKRPISSTATLGSTSGFTVGSTSPLMVSNGNNTSIDVYLSQYSYELFDDSGAAIVDSINGLSDDINSQFDKENQAVDNIGNQTTPSSGSAENATTSSLLQTLQSFVTALQGISATNCNVTLAFPNFAGGSMVVNPCQNKEFTGNIISIGGSLLLISFYIPVAYMLIRKIYSEIRSFTNG